MSILYQPQAHLRIYLPTGCVRLFNIKSMTDSSYLPPLIDITLFHKAISSEATVIVANQRLAKHISNAWGRTILPHASAWEAPKVYSIDGWINNCWDELQDSHAPEVRGQAIIGRAQSQYYWQRAIDSCSDDLGSSYARLAENTFETLTNWDLQHEQIPSSSNSAEHFKNWAKAYLKLLQKNAFITRAQCAHLIAEIFSRDSSQHTETIYVYGFQSIPPLQRRLLAAAARHLEALDLSPLRRASSQTVNTEQAFQESSTCCELPLAKARQIACADGAEEIQLATRWAATELKLNVGQRIAIVVPDLNLRIAELERCVDSALKDIGVTTAVNFSAAVPLANTPLVSAAFDLLGFLDYQQPIAYWLRLLYAPFSSLEQLPLHVRAAAELHMRNTAQFELRPSQFLECFKGADASAVQTAQTLHTFTDIVNKNRRVGAMRKNFSAWADYFQNYLHGLEWPGWRPLNSLEYQQKRQWTQLLEKFSELDNLDIQVGLSRATRILRSMALEHPFHRQTPDAPLQILGLLEASGLHFDKLWVIGLEQKCFPALVDINPLLPSDFQREHDMPHSLPERELQIAQYLLYGFHKNTQSLILSYPQRRGEEILEASPLLRTVAGLDDTIKAQLLRPALTHTALADSDQCELYRQSDVPFNADNERVRGGATLINNQAICPLNAFAIHRLRLPRPESPHQGLSALQRGILLHQIMFAVWNAWGSSEYLSNSTEQLVSDQLEQIVGDVIDNQSRYMVCLKGDRYRLLERRRLHKIINQWLLVERQREPFKILNLEHPVSIKLGPLTLSLTLDRIDLIGDKKLIIDYKSGAVTTRGWHSQRLKDAQLPLYVVATAPTVDGCAFAQLRGGNIKLLGEGNELSDEGLRDNQNWAQQIVQWRADLEYLAEEFNRGCVDLEVHDPAGFVQQSYLLPLNRWTEQTELHKSAGRETNDADR